MDSIEMALLKEFMDKFERIAVSLEQMAAQNKELLAIQKDIAKDQYPGVEDGEG